MKIQVVRDVSDDISTEGTMLVDGVFQCFTLEPVDRHLEVNPNAKVFGQTAIPRGVYPVIIDYSNHFARNLPHILNIPNFAGVRIHPGNWAKDTEGCTLVGQTRGEDFIGSSVAAFDALFPKIEAAIAAGEPITYEVK